MMSLFYLKNWFLKRRTDGRIVFSDRFITFLNFRLRKTFSILTLFSMSTTTSHYNNIKTRKLSELLQNNTSATNTTSHTYTFKFKSNQVLIRSVITVIKSISRNQSNAAKS